MKFYSKLPYHLSAALLILPLQVFANEEKTTAAAKAASSLGSGSLNANPMSGSYLTQLVIGLFIVLLCIVVLAWFAKKMNRFHSAADGSLKVIGGLSMGSRERIVLLQVGEEQLLLGVSPGRISKLHVLGTPLEETGRQTTDTSDGNFLDKLKITMAQANSKSAAKQDKQ
jgi:flagellar protein FliO/FliZ